MKTSKNGGRKSRFDFESNDPGPTTTLAHRERAHAKARAAFAKLKLWSRLKCEAYVQQLDAETIVGLLYLQNRLNAERKREGRIGRLRAVWKLGTTPAEIRQRHPALWKAYHGDHQALSRDLYRIGNAKPA